MPHVRYVDRDGHVLLSVERLWARLLETVQGLVNLCVQILERGCVECERGYFRVCKALECPRGGSNLGKDLNRERL